MQKERKMIMPSEDTIKLLRECNAGVKMGVASIDDVLDQVKNNDFRELLTECKEKHETLGNETREMLNSFQDSGKEPNPVAKSMSWMKTHLKTAVEPGDDTIADLITDGCNMGVKSLHRYLNQYSNAQPKVQSIAKRLITLETQLTENVAQYL